MDASRPLVVRLNAVSFPPSALERSLWEALPAEVREIEGPSPAEILAAAEKATVIMIIAARLPEAVIAALPSLRLIARLGTGTDKIAVEEATRRGVLVTNVPDFSTEEVADHTLALLLAALRRLPHFAAATSQGRRGMEGLRLHRLASRTVALIGFGHIGRAVARRLAGFAPRVLAVDPLLDAATARAHGVETRVLDAALEEADIVCLLCPLLPSTRRMLDAARLAHMRPGAILVNTARGELVDEVALAEALHAGKIGYAALDVFGDTDVFAVGGFATTHPLFRAPNTLLTPHVAAMSEEAMDDCIRRGVAAVADVLAGRWPRYVVNHGVVPRVPLAARPQEIS